MDSPRWLNETEMDAWRALLHIHLAVFGEIERGIQGFGINSVEYGILAYLSEQPNGSLTISDLGEVAYLSLSRLSHRLDNLESLGYVERQPCPYDKRSSYAVLTDAGRDLIERAAPHHVEDVRAAIFDHLTSDQTDRLADALVAIVGEDTLAVRRAHR